MEEDTKRKRGQKREGYKERDPKFIEYYEKNFPDKTHEEHLELKRLYNKSCNYQCIEYYQKRYPDYSIEECEELRKLSIAERRSNCPNNLEYYEKNFPDKTHEEHLEMLHNFSTENNFQCLEYYEKRFPDKTHEEHLEMLRKRKQEYLSKRPNNSGENNPSHHSKTTKQQRKERSVFCIEYWRKKFPEKSDEELLKLKDEKQREILIKSKLVPNCTQLQYWIDKGYDLDEAKKKLKERNTTFSLKKCIEKYGEEKGYEVFNRRQIKWQKSLHASFIRTGRGITQSKWANECINIIKRYIPDIIEELQVANYSFDLAYQNKLIEFNGDFWHCNPSIYDKNYINKTTKRVAKDIWASDKKKIDVAQEMGYVVMTIWESEYKQDSINSINKCIKFLNE